MTKIPPTFSKVGMSDIKGRRELSQFGRIPPARPLFKSSLVARKPWMAICESRIIKASQASVNTISWDPLCSGVLLWRLEQLQQNT